MPDNITGDELKPEEKNYQEIKCPRCGVGKYCAFNELLNPKNPNSEDCITTTNLILEPETDSAKCPNCEFIFTGYALWATKQIPYNAVYGNW